MSKLKYHINVSENCLYQEIIRSYNCEFLRVERDTKVSFKFFCFFSAQKQKPLKKTWQLQGLGYECGQVDIQQFVFNFPKTQQMKSDRELCREQSQFQNTFGEKKDLLNRPSCASKNLKAQRWCILTSADLAKKRNLAESETLFNWTLCGSEVFKLLNSADSL